MKVSQFLLSAASPLLALVHVSPRAAAESIVVLSSVSSVDTRAIDLTAPASGSLSTSPLAVTFVLPANALPGTVRLSFLGNVARELTLASAFEIAGVHHLAFDPGNPTASSAIASGESIPDGVYTLSLAYQDGAGDPPASNASTNVTIDRTPPALVLPPDISVAASGDAGAVVSYPPATASDTLGVTSLTYSKASGSVFPIGVTHVTVTAADAAGNTAVASFAITVTGVQIAVEQPAGTDLTDASPVPIDFGTVVAGSSRSLTFVIRNRGTIDLTDLEVTKALNGTPGDFTLATPLPATLAPGSATTFSVTFAPLAAGARTATLLIANNDPDENPFDIRLAGRQATALEAWRMTYFGSPDNSGPGADLNDGDRDGIVNLLEFATVTDPTVSTPPPGHLIKNGDQLEFTYTRPTAATTELTYTPEASTTLTGPWLPSAPAATTVLSDDGLLQQVKITIPTQFQPLLFLRLRVTRP